MQTSIQPTRRRAHRGFSLVEVLMASSASLLVVFGALWLMFEGVRTSTRSTNASMNDLTQWGIASRLWIDSRIANGITIYADHQAASLERWKRAVVDDRGNFVVFSLSHTDSSNKTYYSRISGYSYDPAARIIYRFDYDVPKADQLANKLLEDILKDNIKSIYASYAPIASSVDPLNKSGVFLCRTAGTAASFACRISTGSVANQTWKEKTIEATFYVRS